MSTCLRVLAALVITNIGSAMSGSVESALLASAIHMAFLQDVRTRSVFLKSPTGGTDPDIVEKTLRAQRLDRNGGDGSSSSRHAGRSFTTYAVQRGQFWVQMSASMARSTS